MHSLLLALALTLPFHAAIEPRPAPLAARDSTAETLFGETVCDPYRWMEASDSPALSRWTEKQTERTQRWLQSQPSYARVIAQLDALMTRPEMSPPFLRQGQLYFFYDDGTQQHASLMRGDPRRRETWQVILSPSDPCFGANDSMGMASVSPDGHYVAYSIVNAGEDWQRWRIRRLADGSEFAETLRQIKFSSPAWLADGSGFYYSRMREPATHRLIAQNSQTQVYFHQVGTEQREDQLVFAHADSAFDASAIVTSDDSAVVVFTSRGTERKQGVYVRDLRHPDSSFVQLAPESHARFGYVAGKAGSLWFLTSQQAPRNRLVRIDASAPLTMHEVLPQHDDTLMQAILLREGIVAIYNHDASSRVSVFARTGEHKHTVPLPEIAWASGLTGDIDDPTGFLSLAGGTFAPEVRAIEVKEGGDALRFTRLFQVDAKENLDDYVTTKLLARTEDGHSLPVFVSHRKDLLCLKTGTCPTRLYGYGGFSLPVYPGLSPDSLLWMKHGGVFAKAVTRGGSEYGDEWAAAGRGRNKQHVFDDFYRAAQLLVDHRITKAPFLGIEGSSNGGLLMGAMLTQHSDSFGAVWCHAGVLDMVRFAEFSAGKSWKQEYGDIQSADDFRTLYAYSPVHRLQSQRTYPATLVCTGDHDDRVVPMHSYKFAAALQAAQAGPAPVFLDVWGQIGHGAGTPRAGALLREAQQLVFFASTIGAHEKMCVH